MVTSAVGEQVLPHFGTFGRRPGFSPKERHRLRALWPATEPWNRMSRLGHNRSLGALNRPEHVLEAAANTLDKPDFVTRSRKKGPALCRATGRRFLGEC
jgi:hypothetical protein